ncbi:MAG: DUF1841 family protein [Woeseiaceae bacterium]|nr:DUF1841 family protein [Woeseiaceae bacterium]
MIFSQDRGELRRMYHDAWRKRREGLPLSPLETQIADVVALHPEYHAALGGDDIDRDYLPDDGLSNPYLHMGLHLGVREQVATDRPAGIRNLFADLERRLGDKHDAEHRMLECLAETLWEAQAGGAPPDEERYLERLRRL